MRERGKEYEWREEEFFFLKKERVEELIESLKEFVWVVSAIFVNLFVILFNYLLFIR